MRRIVIAGGIVIIAGVLLYFGMAGEKGPVYKSALPLDQIWSRGAENAPVVLEEYSDFQCPACAAYYPIVKQLSEEMQGTLKVVYRHFPLRSIHKNSDVATRAAEAAGEQGKFFEMHDILFERQNNWSPDINPSVLFFTYAKELNLDSEAFKAAYKSSDIKKRVERDYQSGIQRGVDSTPTFFLNGKKIEQNPRSYDEFKALLEQTRNAS